MSTSSVSPTAGTRVAVGRKAVRTVTAPSAAVPQLRSTYHEEQQMLRPDEPRRWEPRSPFNRAWYSGHATLRSYGSQDSGTSGKRGLWASSGALQSSVFGSSSGCVQDVREVYTIQQVLRDTLETRRRPRDEKNNVLVRQRHRKEYLRSWSRERIIVTEQIIHPSTNLSVTSAGSSLLNVTGGLGKSGGSAQASPVFHDTSNSFSARNSTGSPSPSHTIGPSGRSHAHFSDQVHVVPVVYRSTSPADKSRKVISRPRLRKQVSEPGTYLFCRLDSFDDHEMGSEDGRQIPLKFTSTILRSPSATSPSLFRKKDNAHVRFASNYRLLEQKDEDQFVQIIYPTERVEALKSIDVVDATTQVYKSSYPAIICEGPFDPHLHASAVQTMPDDRSARTKLQQPQMNSRLAGETAHPVEAVLASTQTTMPPCVPSSSSSSTRSTPDVSSQPLPSQRADRGSTRDDDRSSSVSIYETARSGSSSPTGDLSQQLVSVREEAPLEAAATEVLAATPTQHPEGHRADVATETSVPSSPVYFRTIVRRDHAGYGLTVCGTNPVTVRSIREGGTAERAGLRPGDEIIKVNGLNVEEMEHQDVVDRIRAKSTVCFMLRRMRPSRTYLASIGVITESPAQVTHPARRYQKRRLNRESQPSGSSVAAAVRRRPRNNCASARNNQGSSSGERDPSSSPSAPAWDAESSATEDAVDEMTVTESTEVHEGYASSNHEWDETDFPAATLSTPDGIIADLPPVHPTSSIPSLGSINSGSLGSNSHLLRPRSGTGGPLARPLSIADGGLSLPTPEIGVGSIFQTMPSSMRSKRKVLSPPEQHMEEDFLSALPTNICAPGESGDAFHPRNLRGQSEGPPEFKRINAAPEAPPRGHYPGRNFNDDSEDEAITEEIFDVASRFQSAPAVLASPALCSVLINYLLRQNRELSPILFYLVAKHYSWIITTNKSLATSDRRFLIEIFSTFLHEKSPLPVKVDPLIIQQMEETISSNSPATVFDRCCDYVLPQIQSQLERLNKDIRYGLDIWKPADNFDILMEHTSEEELGIFEGAIAPCLLELDRIIADGSAAAASVTSATNGRATGTAVADLRSPLMPSSNCATWVAATAKRTNYSLKKTALALKISLVTAYWYFKLSKCTSATDLLSTSGSIDESSSVTSPTTPISLHSSRKSYLARSIENLAAQATGGRAGASNLNSHAFSGSLSSGLPFVGTIKWQKLPCFNSKIKSKTPSAAIFGRMKSTNSIKGHNLQERCFERIAECAVCEELLWGLAPQGFSCQNCDLCVHQKCKSSIKDNCSKDNKMRASSNNITGNSVSPVGSSGFSSLRLNSARSTIYGSLNLSSPSASWQPSQQQQQSDQTSTMGPRTYCTWHARRRLPYRTPLMSLLSGDGQKNPVKQYSGGPCEEEKSLLAASTEDIHHCRNHSWGEVFQPSPALPSSGFVSVNEPSSIPKASSPADLTAPSNAGRSNRVNIGYSQSISYRRSDGLKSPEFTARYVRQVKQPYENYFSGSENRLSKHATSTLSLLSPSEQEKRSFTSSVAENMQKLCPDDWSDDPEMKEQESFDATIELQTHFPNYEVPTKGPRVQDHVRTLVLLEFHQKVRYMVSYLKQFDYLLIRPWPIEHQYLAKMLCLDHIPVLIELFRSLVTVIESTVEPQGYGDLANAVLEWLTVNNGENLKAWSRHCQALSCTNMLDCVKAARREYARKNPRIQPLLETRFNKFVLIDGLTQMRVLYFNLPLIVKNIMKDLEKKTTKYKEEAKVWQEIYVKLSGLPYSIDTVCMPLVKLINNGQFYSTVDKKEQLTRHQAQGGTVPFSTLLLEFPRTLFQYYVVDHAEVTVDKFTFTSETKINYDYLREKTDVLAILLEDALLLLIKEGDRFVMRPFKPSKEQGMGPETPTPSSSVPTASAFSSASGTVNQLTTAGTASSVNLSDRPSGNTLGNTMKLLPVFPLDSVFTSRGENIGGEYMLNMIFKKLAVLLRIFFTKKDLRERWYHTLKALEERVTSSLYNAHTFDRGSRAGSCCPSERSSASEVLHSRENSGDLQESKPPLQPEETSETEVEDKKISAESAETLESCQVTEGWAESTGSSEEVPNDEIKQLAEECNKINQRIMDLVKSIDSDDTGYAARTRKEPLRDELLSDRQRLVFELILTTRWLDFVSERLRGGLNASSFAAHKRLSDSFSWEADSTDSKCQSAAVSYKAQVSVNAHCRLVSSTVESENTSHFRVQSNGSKRQRSESAFVDRFGNLQEDVEEEEAEEEEDDDDDDDKREDEKEGSLCQSTANDEDVEKSRKLRDLQKLASMLSRAAHNALLSATSKSEGEDARGTERSVIKQAECGLIPAVAQKENSVGFTTSGCIESKSHAADVTHSPKEMAAITMKQDGGNKDENDADTKTAGSISAVSEAADKYYLRELEDDGCNEDLRVVARELCDEIINSALLHATTSKPPLESFEEEVEAVAADLVENVLACAYDRLTWPTDQSSVALSTMDSGMGSLLEQSTLSDGVQDELSVTNSKPRTASQNLTANPNPTEQRNPPEI